MSGNLVGYAYLIAATDSRFQFIDKNQTWF